MKDKTGNLIVGRFRDKPVQPSYDEPLQLELSPIMIYRCFLFDCDRFQTTDHSIIHEENMNICNEHFIANGDNYVRLFRAEWIEDDETEDELEREMEAYMLEIKIGKVFLYADFGTTSATEYKQTCQDDMERRAENAFIIMAGLLGVRVGRGLITITDK